MISMSKRTTILFAAFSAVLLLQGCSQGPAPPEKGTPAFYWQAARETFATGDYAKTNDHLEALNKSPNEFTTKAQPWLLVLSSGLAQGYMDMADKFEYGARANKTNPTPFRRKTSDCRTMANRHVLEFAEAFDKFVKANKDETISFAFAFPSGTVTPVMELTKASTGVMLQESEFSNAQRRAISRAVLLEACRAAGASDDTAKAQAIFKSATASVPRATFLLAMANSIYDHAQLYTPQKLDNPDRLKMLLARAQDALKGVPESKESKELAKKIDASLKKGKK